MSTTPAGCALRQIVHDGTVGSASQNEGPRAERPRRRRFTSEYRQAILAEHHLLSHITMNWRGRPLTSHEVVVNSIAATRTRTGLTVAAELDTNAYPLGVSVSAERMSMLPITPRTERGSWNYTIGPADDTRTNPYVTTGAYPVRKPARFGRSPADRDEPRGAERAGCVFGPGSGGPGRAAR
uniref:Mobile element protein n=1 Tax=Nonomuraea gerenzanensis TaxID=93944 RepID=A0A1M4E5Z2_9ACTN|nr:Mobile element protein [Nonomuraea gerenzanensis]